MIQILHNPRCRKSREGLAYLESKNVDFEIIEYLQNPLQVDELREIIKKTGLPIQELLRQKDENYKEFIKNKPLSEDQILELMIKYPKMIQRPIVIAGSKAVVAKPPEKIDELF